ncbi:Carbohydrate esterase 4 protein [Ceratobasidium sp. 394]|nr:Carbohydrate esterase 4 protein [Ceratobasidium sp. 394]KAG9083277.1 Carbohydrate esterase 4 protein [Ceratobasidium sp. UAMH 11750]
MYALTRTLVYAAILGTVLGRPTDQQRRAPGVITSCTVPNTAALTFDDGPYKWNREVVDTLSSKGARGTFFVNGNNYDCIYNGDNPDHLRYAYDQGHQIASHTWAHLHLPSLSSSKMESEFSRTNDAIQKITGAVPAFVRPPYGDFNQAVLTTASQFGQTVVTWDFDSGDSAGKSAAASEAAYQELMDRHPNNILTLNHETYSSTVNDLLPHAIDTLQQAGYNLVTVAECLGMDPYLSTGAPSEPDGSWTC